jgi:hypothetical protein
MAAGDQVIIGAVVNIGYGSFSYTGYIPQSVTNSRTADVATIKDERNANITHIISNPGKSINFTAMIKTSGGSITPPDIGDLITLTPPEGTAQKYILLSPATVTHGTEAATISMTLVREDSMAATYDA